MTDMATSLHLTRRGATPRASVGLLGDLRLDRGRVHEFCGPARRTLALIAARGGAGPVLWITPLRETERLNPDGMAGLIDPGRLIFVAPNRGDDALWVMEEALRSGSVPTVVAEMAEPPGLTPVRRLQLAAEAGLAAGGASSGGGALGLILTPEAGGAQGVESRWHLAQTPGGWRLERLRARMQPPKGWQVLAPGLRLVDPVAAVPTKV